MKLRKEKEQKKKEQLEMVKRNQKSNCFHAKPDQCGIEINGDGDYYIILEQFDVTWLNQIYNRKRRLFRVQQLIIKIHCNNKKNII